MSKRRVFDIDFDEETVPAGTGDEAPARRGPMAAAISENAEALGARQTAEAEIRAENDRLAHEYVALKKNGQIVGMVALDDVRMTKLVRDRAADRDPDIEELKSSILAVGLSNPIHVEEVEDGYELIQGFRRLSAYRELRKETGEARFDSIPATLQARGAQLDHLYRRMVDENLVRRDISFAEMAQLAMSYANRSGLSVAAAIETLYASGGRQKRNYIRHFAHLLTVLGDDLRFPETIPRATGLSLVKLLEDNTRFAGQVRAVLNSQPGRDAALELTLLRSAVSGVQKKSKANKPQASKTSARTTIKLSRPEGVAKCTASAGKFEVTLDHDFGAIEPRRLEAAARAFLDHLKN